MDRTKSANGLAEYLLVTEFCTGGALIDYVNETIDAETVLKIFYQAAQAVKHLHFQTPPIIHRDIKIENFLLGADGLVKLCDFGSATTDAIQPDPSWNANTRNALEDKLAMFTTPMYRAPEQLDTWENRLIGPKTDIWALGCILYVLCFQKHPFDDSAKLRIINGNYTLPSNSAYAHFHAIIKGCLQTNPDQRFDISIVLERLAAIAESHEFNPRGPIKLRAKTKALDLSLDHDVLLTEPNRPPTRPPPDRPEPPRNTRPPAPQHQPPAPNQHYHAPANHVSVTATSAGGGVAGASAAPTNGLFASIKGGAGSFLKNLKDTSSKVMQTVQQSMTKSDLDISYITSRILVMPCPPEGLEAAYKANHLEYIKVFLESKYRLSQISVYNFGPRSAPRLPPPVRTVEGASIFYPTPPRAPSLRGLYGIVEDMYGFLCADPKNIVIVQSGDQGRSVAATIVTALLIYGSLIIEPEDGIQMFAVKRIPPNMRPSELRYLYYMTDVVRSKPYPPHFKPVTLQTLTIGPVPRMTKARDGCRFFVEITCNEKVVMTSLDEYDRMPLYHASEGKITINLNQTVCGDMCVAMYHARKTLGGMGGGRPTGIKICQFQLNTGYIPEQEILLSYDKSELDEMTDCDQFLTNLNVSLSISVGSEECPPSTTLPWMNGKNVARNPVFLFSSEQEMQENVENFVTVRKSRVDEHQQNKPSRPAPVRPPAPPSSPRPDRSNDSSSSVQPDLVQHTEEANRASSASNQEFDLLNLNQNGGATHHETFQHVAGGGGPVRPPPPTQPTKAMSFDLLGFNQPEVDHGVLNQPAAAQPPPHIENIDLLGGSGFAAPPQSSNANDSTSFNLLGNLNLNLNSMSLNANNSEQSNSSGVAFDQFSNLLQPNKSPQNTFQDRPDPAPAATTSSDPFADLGSFVRNNISVKQAEPMANLFATSPNNHQQPQSQPINILPTPSPSASHNTTPTHQGRRNPQPEPMVEQKKPDYSRSHFADPTKGAKQPTASSGGGGATAKPTVAGAGGGLGGLGGLGGGVGGGDIFADILGSQGYNFASKTQGPRTINDMRKEDIVKEMDPERFKIMEWVG